MSDDRKCPRCGAEGAQTGLYSVYIEVRDDERERAVPPPSFSPNVWQMVACKRCCWRTLLEHAASMMRESDGG